MYDADVVSNIISLDSLIAFIKFSSAYFVEHASILLAILYSSLEKEDVSKDKFNFSAKYS